MLHKLHGFNVLHALTGHDRRREGRGWRERTTGHECLCRNEFRAGNAGGSIDSACLGAGDSEMRVHTGSLGLECACTVFQGISWLLLTAYTAATAFSAKRLDPSNTCGDTLGLVRIPILHAAVDAARVSLCDLRILPPCPSRLQNPRKANRNQAWGSRDGKPSARSASLATTPDREPKLPVCEFLLSGYSGRSMVRSCAHGRTAL